MAKNIHFFCFDKFTIDYINDINACFPKHENQFIVFPNKMNDSEKKLLLNFPNATVIDDKKSLNLKNIVKNSSQIFLHSLECLHIFKILRILFQWKKPTFWVIWGYDLYIYQERYKSLKSIIKHVLRKIAIKKLSGIIFDVKGEYELAKKWYHTKAPYIEAGYLPDFSAIDAPPQFKKDGIHRILVNYSANYRNNHFEVFEKIKQLSLPLDNYEIIVPLSYSENKPGYKNEVIEKGKQLFGDSFIPLVEYMSIQDYCSLLKTIDFAFFAADRQIATINIEFLLVFGAKVYIRDDITSWNHFKELGCKIFSYNSDFPTNISELTELEQVDKGSNREIILRKYSIDTFKSEWSKIL